MDSIHHVVSGGMWHVTWIDDLFDQMKGTTVFSKIDLQSVYHQLQIKEDDVPKIAFKMRFGNYEFIVLLFWTNKCPRGIYEFGEWGFP
jgi:hypothetical protein